MPAPHNNYMTMQRLLRDLRRLMRHPLVVEVVCADARDHILEATRLLAQRFTEVGGRPRFVGAKLRRMILGALRSAENGRRSWTFEERYLDAVWQALRLLKGVFCGRACPDPSHCHCSICLSGAGGDWWWLYKCGHYFHVNCIAASLTHDSRCPLCRIEI
jgi:hypothetical protein